MYLNIDIHAYIYVYICTYIYIAPFVSNTRMNPNRWEVSTTARLGPSTGGGRGCVSVDKY